MYRFGRGVRIALVSTAMLAMGIAAASSPAVAKKVTMTWYIGNVSGQSTWAELVRMYEKDHPGVKVTLITGDGDKFYTMITAGLMPDVWGPYGTPGIKADVNRNWAVELTPYIARDSKVLDMADFFPGLMREFRVNGKQYSLPYMCWEDYFFYNPVMYAEAGLNPPPVDAGDRGWNWERMVFNAQKLTKYDSTGKIRTGGIDVERSLGSPPSYMHVWGAEPYSDVALRSSVPQAVDWSSPPFVTALTKAHELIYKYKVMNAADEWGAFENRRVAQSMKAEWVIQYIMPTKTAKWAIANNPWGVTNAGTMWPDGWRMSRVSKNKDEVWEFIKFLCSKKTLTYLVTAPKSPFAAVPMARRSVFQESLGENIAKLTGMNVADVLKVQEQADAVNIVKFQETICIHSDLTGKFLDPLMVELWSNKTSPTQMAAKLQDVTNKRLPELFKRWIRNIRFTGQEPR